MIKPGKLILNQVGNFKLPQMGKITLPLTPQVQYCYEDHHMIQMGQPALPMFYRDKAMLLLYSLHSLRNALHILARQHRSNRAVLSFPSDIAPTCFP